MSQLVLTPKISEKAIYLAERGVLAISGAVPGPKRGLVMIKGAI